jgi:hypothetical protein
MQLRDHKPQIPFQLDFLENEGESTNREALIESAFMTEFV